MALLSFYLFNLYFSNNLHALHAKCFRTYYIHFTLLWSCYLVFGSNYRFCIFWKCMFRAPFIHFMYSNSWYFTDTLNAKWKLSLGSTFYPMWNALYLKMQLFHDKTARVCNICLEPAGENLILKGMLLFVFMSYLLICFIIRLDLREDQEKKQDRYFLINNIKVPMRSPFLNVSLTHS